MLLLNIASVNTYSVNTYSIDTCSSPDLDEAKRARRLLRWEDAPHARYCHPREEHLLPLHVCLGAARGATAVQAWQGDMMGYRMSAFLWR